MTKGDAPDQTEREWGVRNYVDTTGSVNNERRATEKMVTDQGRRQPHSEFKKPYREDDYQEMEYWYNLPAWQFPPFDFSLPDFPVDVYKTTYPNPYYDQDDEWYSGGIGDDVINDPEPGRPGTPGGPGPWTRYGCAIDCNGGLNCGDIRCMTRTASFFPGQEPIGSWSIEGPHGEVVVQNRTITISPPEDRGSYDSLSRSYIVVCFTDGVGNVCCEEDHFTCPCDCEADIGYTATMMNIGGSQTLTVENKTAGCEDFTWSAVHGTISPETGESVTYTAAANVDGCSNATDTITLKSCDGSVTIDTLTITVTNYAPFGNPNYIAYFGIVSNNCGNPCCWNLVWTRYTCMAYTPYSPGNCAFCDCNSGPDCNCGFGGLYCTEAGLESYCSADPGGCVAEPGVGTCAPGNYDQRTQAAIDDGCCPEALGPYE